MKPLGILSLPGSDAHELLKLAVLADSRHGGDSAHGPAEALLGDLKLSRPRSLTVDVRRNRGGGCLYMILDFFEHIPYVHLT